MNTPEALEGMLRDLVRRGLPADYAQRAADEFADHHRDLVDELQAAGWSASEAADEASRRLGDTRTLVKKTVREHQQRFWCARWPLITFLIAPIPAVVASWFALGCALWLCVAALTRLGLTTASDADAAFNGLPVQVKYATLVAIFLIVPSAVLVLFARLAKRAAMGWQWILVTACVLGLAAGECKWERVGPGSKLVMTDRTTGNVIEHPPQPDFVLTMWIPYDLSWGQIRQQFFSNAIQPCQLFLPTGLAALFLIRRQKASQVVIRLGSC